jgi:hypothetical protein
MLTTDLYFCDAKGNYYIFKDVEALGDIIASFAAILAATLLQF